MATADAEAAVNQLAAQIWQTLGQTELGEQGRIDAIAARMSDATDVDLLSRLVLARYWQQLDDEQKARYQALFGDVVMRKLREPSRPVRQRCAGTARGTLHDRLERARRQAGHPGALAGATAVGRHAGGRLAAARAATAGR